MITPQTVGLVAQLALGPDVYRATKFLGPDLVVRATRPHKYDRRNRSNTVVVTVGKPNYREREFIKACRKAGEPLPVKKIQLQAPKAPKNKRGGGKRRKGY